MNAIELTEEALKKGYDQGFDIGYIMGHVHLVYNVMDGQNPAKVHNLIRTLQLFWIAELDEWEEPLRMCLESMSEAGQYNWICAIFSSLLPENQRTQ